MSVCACLLFFCVFFFLCNKLELRWLYHAHTRKKLAYIDIELYRENELFSQATDRQTGGQTSLIRRAKLGKIQGGLQRASQDSTKGGPVAIFFYFLRVKNIMQLKRPAFKNFTL